MPKSQNVVLDNPDNEKRSEPKRRSFLRKLWVGLGILALAEFIVVGFSFLRPKKSVVKKGNGENIIEAGAVENFDKESVTAFVRGEFYLSRLSDGGFLALSRQCTHLGCTVPWNSEKKKFLCPCHSSSFDITGKVISAPAPRALDIYPVSIENGIVMVDTAKKIRRSVFDASQVVYFTV